MQKERMKSYEKEDSGVVGYEVVVVGVVEENMMVVQGWTLRL